MKKQISFMISTLFYVGYFPKAPGTIGSFVSLFLVALINFYFVIIGLLSLIIISFNSLDKFQNKWIFYYYVLQENPHSAFFNAKFGMFLLDLKMYDEAEKNY